LVTYYLPLIICWGSAQINPVKSLCFLDFCKYKVTHIPTLVHSSTVYFSFDMSRGTYIVSSSLESLVLYLAIIFLLYMIMCFIVSLSLIGLVLHLEVQVLLFMITCYIVDHDVFILCKTPDGLVCPSSIWIHVNLHFKHVVCYYSGPSNWVNLC
jgi:hypothetical protein